MGHEQVLSDISPEETRKLERVEGYLDQLRLQHPGIEDERLRLVAESTADILHQAEEWSLYGKQGEFSYSSTLYDLEFEVQGGKRSEQ